MTRMAGFVSTRVATALAILAALGAAASAHASTAHRDTSFQGTCAFSANVIFRPPLGATPQQGTDYAAGSGTCSGVFVDRKGRTRPLDGGTVGYVAWDRGPSSCAEGAATGGGYLSYRGSRLHFKLTEDRAGAAAALHFDGARGGSADGDARVSPDTNPSDVLQSCLGAGLRQARVDINFATTPKIAG